MFGSLGFMGGLKKCEAEEKKMDEARTIVLSGGGVLSANTFQNPSSAAHSVILR